MRFFFDRRKAAQAAAYLIQLHGGVLNLMALLKLLYLADRTALVDAGYPITGDKMVSMPHGPVLSQIYDSVKWGSTGDEDPWYKCITERDGHDVSLVNENPDHDELSDYEIGVLTQIHEQYGHLNQYELRDLTHDLPEWNDPNGSSSPIEPADILRAEGKNPEEIQRLTHVGEELLFLKSLSDL